MNDTKTDRRGLDLAPGSAYRPPQALWVRFGKERAIVGQWDFEPFPPAMCEEMGVIKYTRDPSPNIRDEPRAKRVGSGPWLGASGASTTQGAEPTQQANDHP